LVVASRGFSPSYLPSPRHRLVVTLPLLSPSTASTWSRHDLSSRRLRLVVTSRHLLPLLTPSTASSASSRNSLRRRLVVA
jgi:hypothetical protein